MGGGTIVLGWATRSIVQVLCNKPNEETYPGPLLVNMELLYPHREWPTITVDPYSAICDDHTYIHTYFGMHHRCITGECRHLGLARGTNIIMCCSSLDFLCILEERFKIVVIGKTIVWLNSKKPSRAGGESGVFPCRLQQTNWKMRAMRTVAVFTNTINTAFVRHTKTYMLVWRIKISDNIEKIHTRTRYIVYRHVLHVTPTTTVQVGKG